MPGKDDVERRCALTHEVKPAADLIRFVVGPDGVVVPDTDARAEGRGVWISLGEHSVAEAVKKKAFARSLKEAVTVPADLPELTRLRLEQRFVSSLQMAKKAGQLLTGMTSSETFETPLEPGTHVTERTRDSAVCIAGLISKSTLMSTYGFTDAQARDFFKQQMTLRLNVSGTAQYVDFAALYFGWRIVGD